MGDPDTTFLGRMAMRFTAFAERFIPDAFVFALVATLIVVVAAAGFTPRSLGEIVDLWGDGFFELIPFTMQMAMIIISGYVVASSPPVHALIGRLATVTDHPRGAVVFVAMFAMVTSWFNWGFSLIFSAILAKEIARRTDKVDYRALGAAAFMGLGSIWAQGLSGSAALLMATEATLPKAIKSVVSQDGLVASGTIGLEYTIFTWQSFVAVFAEMAVVSLVMFLASPTGERVRSAKMLDISLESDANVGRAHANTPGEWLEYVPWLSMGFVGLSVVYLLRYALRAEQVLQAINFNTINLLLLTLGAALHRTPARLMRAVREATPGVWAIILQYPLYAGIAALIGKTHLNESIADFFVKLSSPATLPAIVATYSALLGMFVPSGGSKWVIEAPYVLSAAHDLKVHLGWMVVSYDLGEALANLIQPFWMLPVLGLMKLRARDVMGYTFLMFLVLAPVVMLLLTVLGTTLSYPL